MPFSEPTVKSVPKAPIRVSSSAKAIAESETGRGKGRLSLMVRRDGQDVTVDVPLRVMGSYSDTWPYECKKSQKILHEACAFLAARQYPNGYFPAETGISTSWAGLLFLASGEAQYLDNARRAAYWLAEQSYPDMPLHNWPAGYAGVFLAEYYLATGDRSVLPKLQSLCDFLAKGQMGFGSWAHNSPFGGYGAVNQVGLVCFMALILADECGMALFYALPLKSLRILGAEKGPFDDNAGDEIAKLVELFQRRESDALQTGSTELIEGDRLSAEQKTRVKQLQSIAATHRQSVALTLSAIRTAVDDEDAYRGAEMPAGLERLLGKDCPELVAARGLINMHASNVAYGRRYYKLWSDLVYCAGDFWLPYGKRAMREVGSMGPLAPRPWHTIAETSQQQKQDWKVLRVSGETVEPKTVEPPAAAQTQWQQPGFDDSRWLQETGPFNLRPNRNAAAKDATLYLRRTFEIENPDFHALRLSFTSNSRRQNADVYLNAVLVARLYDGSGRVYVKVALRPEACSALRRGANCLAVRCHNDDGRGLAIDVGLQGTRP